MIKKKIEFFYFEVFILLLSIYCVFAIKPVLTIDTYNIIYPRLLLIQKYITDFKIPFWIRYGNSGFDFFSSGIYPFFDPFQVLMFLFKGSSLISLYSKIIVFFIGLSIYWWLRYFKCKPISAIYCVFAFFCVPYFKWRIYLTSTSYIIFMLISTVFLYEWLKKKKYFYYFISVISGSLTFYAADVQGFIFYFVWISGMFLIYSVKNDKKFSSSFWITFICFSLNIILLCSFQLLPFLNNLSNSIRANNDVFYFSLKNILSLFISNLDYNNTYGITPYLNLPIISFFLTGLFFKNKIKNKYFENLIFLFFFIIVILIFCFISAAFKSPRLLHL